MNNEVEIGCNNPSETASGSTEQVQASSVTDGPQLPTQPAAPPVEDEICRICLTNRGPDGEVLLSLDCDCKDELAFVHKQCAETWFHSQGSTRCEICRQISKNVTSIRFLAPSPRRVQDLTAQDLRTLLTPPTDDAAIAIHDDPTSIPPADPVEEPEEQHPDPPSRCSTAFLSHILWILMKISSTSSACPFSTSCCGNLCCFLYSVSVAWIVSAFIAVVGLWGLLILYRKHSRT